MKFEVKYNVKEEDRLVIAMLTVSKENEHPYKPQPWTSVLYDSLNTVGAAVNSGNHSYLTLRYDGAFIPNKYVGVARCMEGDTFDPEVGKRIAEYKAYKKYYARRKKTIHNIVKEVNAHHSRAVGGLSEVAKRDAMMWNSIEERFLAEFGDKYISAEKEL